MTTVEIQLSDTLAKEAQAAGLLSSEAIEALLREAVRQRRISRLFEAKEKLQVAGIPPMTAEQIEAEIRAAREEARRAAGS